MLQTALLFLVHTAVYGQNVPTMRYLHRDFASDTDDIFLSDSVTVARELHLNFEVSADTLLNNMSPRVVTTSSGPDLSVAVRHPAGQFSWQHTPEKSSTIGRTVWLDMKSLQNASSVSFTVIFTTAQTDSVSFNANITLVQNRLVLNASSSEIVSPTTPYVWQYTNVEEEEQEEEDHNRTKTVIVHVTSATENACGIVALQPLSSQFHDQEFDVTFKSRWQTMLSQAIIDVRLEGMFKEGFFVVGKTFADNSACWVNGSKEASDKDRQKEMTVTVSERISDRSVAVTSVVVFLIYLISCSLAIILAYCFGVPLQGKYITKVKGLASSASKKIKRSRRYTSGVVVDAHMEMEVVGDRHGDGDEVDGGACPQNMQNGACAHDQQEPDFVDGNVISGGGAANRGGDDEPDSIRTVLSEIRERAQNFLLSVTNRENNGVSSQDVIINMYKQQLQARKQDTCDKVSDGKQLTLADLAVTCGVDKDLFHGTAKLKSSLYHWIISLIGIFYTLPVFQLLMSNQNTSIDEGNLDICYYNFLCKIPVLRLEDYGHVFSNVSYVISGLLFIAMVRIRQSNYKAYLRNRWRDGERRRSVGIPEQYGIFYALGLALALEGVLSACYHICPTHVNFQFDTTFMYIIAVLVFLKVYQFRHPDITSNAYYVFAVIGGALIVEVIGYYTENWVYWLVFVTCYLFVLVLFTIHTYYDGMFALFGQCVSNSFKERNLKVFRPARMHKFLLSLVVIAINCVCAAFFVIKRSRGISKYLLIILMLNMTLYVSYYICMKLYYRYLHRPSSLNSPEHNSSIRGIKSEGINRVCVVYFVLSLAFMAVGVYYFSQELRNSSLSPAESRDKNGPCVVLSLFDNHDIWHFASAAGLFFNFMVVLTLEDNNLETPWEEIKVF